MELLDGLVDLQHMEGPGNSFQVLHDLEEPGGPVHGHEAHRFGLLRSRDVLQVSLSCGSLGASDKDDSMAMFNHQHTSLHHYHHHHHEHAFTSLPLQEAPGTIVEEEEGQAKLRALPVTMVQAAAPAQRTCAVATVSDPYYHDEGYMQETLGPTATSRPKPRKRAASSLGAPTRAGWRIDEGRAGRGSTGGKAGSAGHPRRQKAVRGADFADPGGDAGGDSSTESGEYCYICRGFYSEPVVTEEQPGGEMLLCDGCDKGWHQYCVDPPVTDIPPEQEPWYCPMCCASNPVALAYTATRSLRLGPPQPPPPQPPPAAPPAHEAGTVVVAGAAEPAKNATHSSQGAVTVVGVDGVAAVGAGVKSEGQAGPRHDSGKKDSGETTSSNASVAVKAEVVEEGGVESGRRSARVALRAKSLHAVKEDPTPAPHTRANPRSPTKGTRGGAAMPSPPAAAAAAVPAGPLPSVCRPEKARKYGATGKQALRLTNYVGRLFFGLGPTCSSLELGPVKVELDGEVLPEVYTGAKVVLDHANSSPRLINFGGRHIVGIHYDCGARREPNGTVVLVVTSQEPDTTKWAAETEAALQAAAAAATTPKPAEAKPGRQGSGPPMPPPPSHAPVRLPSLPLPSTPARAPQPPPPQPPQPPPPPTPPMPPLPTVIRPNKLRQLVTERGRKMCLSRMVFEAMWPGVTEGIPVETQLDFYVDGRQVGSRRTAHIKMSEGGRVYASGVTWQEALHLWDCGMQRLSPKLVALYASAVPPSTLIAATPILPGLTPIASKLDGAAPPTVDARPPKRSRRDAATPAALPSPPAPKLGRLLSGTPASAAKGAGSASTPVGTRHSPPHADAAGAGASNESAAAPNAPVSMAQLQQGGQALQELGQTMGFSAAQRIAALKSVYALAKEPGQLQLQLFLCVGLPHVKAEVDAGRIAEAWVALREVLPDL